MDFGNRFIKNHKIYIEVMRYTKSATKILLKFCKESHKVVKTMQGVIKLTKRNDNKKKKKRKKKLDTSKTSF